MGGLFDVLHCAFIDACQPQLDETRSRKLTDEAPAYLQQVLNEVANDQVELVVRGRFAYVEYEDMPSCSLEFTGDLPAWECSIRGPSPR